jgi:hypothetical protein
MARIRWETYLADHRSNINHHASFEGAGQARLRDAINKGERYKGASAHREFIDRLGESYRGSST